MLFSFYKYFWPPPPPPPPPPREVIFGRKPLDGGVGLAHHWAIKVGETWYEIEGASVKEKGSINTIAASDGQASKCGAKPCKVFQLHYADMIKDWKIKYFKNGFVLILLIPLFGGFLLISFSFMAIGSFIKWAFLNKKPGKYLPK